MGLSASGNLIAFHHIFNNTVSLSSSVLPTGAWHHAVQTFSTTNGLRLYMNGTIYASTPAASYYGSGVPDTLTFGNPLNGTSCASPFTSKQFYGSIDEVKLYSRELTSLEAAEFYLSP